MNDPQPDAPLAPATPYIVAFLASFCVMAVEMVAGRMVSRYVGTSLFTWTSVIGVVLAGITIGNTVGGRLADRFPGRKLLASVIFFAGVACVAIPLMNHGMAVTSQWQIASTESWPWRVARQIFCVFFVPSTILGLVGPAVAKAALDRGLETGRTVGNVYAWGALGSIVGTFAAGFFLVSTVGSTGVAILCGVLLMAVGTLLSWRSLPRLLLLSWPILLASVAGLEFVKTYKIREWAFADGKPVIKEKPRSGALYEDETQYSFIKVIETDGGETWSLFLDNLVHAVYRPSDYLQLEYQYEKIYASVTERFGRKIENLNCLFLGGGGYIFPRYVQTLWPKSRLEVAEIDPGVTEANFEMFGLKRESVRIMDRGGPEAPVETGAGKVPNPILIYHLDARNHVEDILRRKREGKDFAPFDLVFGDAFNDFTVPSHLVTLEFTQKLKEILKPGSGLYVMNIIDMYYSSRFLGAIYNTMRRVFPRVYVYTNTKGGPNESEIGRDTFIVIGSLRDEDLDLADLGLRPGELPFTGALLTPDQLKVLEERSRGVVLTDDYAPVENLLERVVRMRGRQ